ncbi:MAG: DUF4037 domain-containing protein [Spirochaetaceae bacterium]|nr:DUF4037 domain-containing protein [Spirochaetaceae bacterium]RKX99008.1 MAG: hypothetical protein DRZ90_00620 [Spirochaetota bacterium]
MKGMELSRRYYDKVVFPAFERLAADELDLMTFGLSGPGSECYGYDDKLSRDHDWGPRVCIWIPEELYRQKSDRLKEIYEELDNHFLGYGPIKRLDTRIQRDGILSTSNYYKNFLGTDRPPENLHDWLLLPEESLSLCTNGEIFREGSGLFCNMRQVLKTYFPPDLWLKKISSRCKAASQHGQYNLLRADRRDDRLAVEHHKSRFIYETVSLVFLLNRTYHPIDKWLFKGLGRLGILGVDITEDLRAIIAVKRGRELYNRVDRCAERLIDELVRQGLLNHQGSFLYNYGMRIEQKIVDTSLRLGLDSIV